jgi:hypothetical protein
MHMTERTLSKSESWRASSLLRLDGKPLHILKTYWDVVPDIGFMLKCVVWRNERVLQPNKVFRPFRPLITNASGPGSEILTRVGLGVRQA